MAVRESIHQKLERVRKPHVHITYEVYTGDAMEKRELPFVVGVLADLSGNNPGKQQPGLEQRKFISIDRDNFNEVMRRMTPGTSFRVENTLQKDGTEIAVQLKFDSIEDFEPGRVLDQVEPLKKMLDARNKLRDLLTNIDRASPEVERLFEEVLKNTEKQAALAKEIGSDNTKQGGE